MHHTADELEDRGISLPALADDAFLENFQRKAKMNTEDLQKYGDVLLEFWRPRQRQASGNTPMLKVVTSDYVHEVSPGIMVILGGAASSRKTSNNAFATSMLHDSPHADTKLKETFLVEATLKGCRTSLLNLGAFALVSDEISNSLQTPWSDPSSGINFMSRSKLNTFSQAEPDAVITGLGRVSLTSYKVLVRLWGQTEAAEWTLKPTPSGFPKRCSVAFSPDRNPISDVPTEWSVGFLRQLHDFCLGRVSKTPQRCGPDPFAVPCH